MIRRFYGRFFVSNVSLTCMRHFVIAPLTELGFNFTAENKFGFKSNILKVRIFLNFLSYQIEEKVAEVFV